MIIYRTSEVNMAEKGKKQTSKKRGVNARTVQKPKTSSSARPASFSRNAANKPEAEQFETLKITRAEKTHEPKIIIRDVAKEAPVSKKTISKQPEKPLKKVAIKKSAPAPVAKPTAKEIKEYEIKKAVNSAKRIHETETHRGRKRFSYNFSFARAALVTVCSTIIVFAIVYFVNLTSTDMSLKVAAMQSGIEASYPDYIPRGFTLSDVSSMSGKVSMTFKNGDSSYTISEENSNWDSNALLNNYVKVNYGDEYTVIRENGLTLYMGDRWETWVNGGMLYKLTVNSGELTKKQMKTIATSL